MAIFPRFAAAAAAITFSFGLLIVDSKSELQAQTRNPCAPKAANPCAPKAANPCAPKTGASADKPEIAPKLVLRPAGTKLASGKKADLVKRGKTLFNSTKLSTNGLSCANCHQNLENFANDFAKPYPHQVAMANEKSGLAEIQLDEMVQLCMIVPMAAKPLKWDSRELAALTAYTSELQTEFQKRPKKAGAKAANPCAPKGANPCAPGRK